MPDEENPEPTAFEESREAVRSAQFKLNLLVVMSATAASVFLFFVISRIWPSNGPAGSNVEIPTSAVTEMVGLLSGSHQGPDLKLRIELRDLDDAPGYRDAYGRKLRTALGITQAGRLYNLHVFNESKSGSFEFKPERLMVQDGHGHEWRVRWLAEVASQEGANPVGRMTLTQAERRFTLAAGESRELTVFTPREGGNAPPPAGKLTGGSLSIEQAGRIKLEPLEIRAER